METRSISWRHPKGPTPLSKAPRTTTSVAVPLMLKLLVVSIVLPDEIGVDMQGLLFTPSRILLLGFVPILLLRLTRKLIAGSYRFVWADLLVPLAGVWMFIALGNVDGIQAALNHAGPLALEFCIGYMTTRIMLSGNIQTIFFIQFLCWVLALVAVLGIFDTLSNRFVIHDLAAAAFGNKIFGTAGHRLGLLRATSTIEHPILFGFVCSVGFILSISTPIRGRWLSAIGSGLGTFLSLSSAPIQVAVLGVSLLMYNRMLLSVKVRWAALTTLLAAAFTILFLIANHPFGFIFDHLTFDPETGYFRMYAWQTAGEALNQSPWFGLGWIIPDVYGIPGTVDSIWLVWALNFGIPGSILLGLSMLGAMSLPRNSSRALLTTAELKLRTTLSIIIFLIVFLGFTVHFFGTSWILIPVLVGVRAHLAELGRVSYDLSGRTGGM